MQWVTTTRGQYLCEEKVGVGAFAEVYRAHGADGRLYAIKIIQQKWADEDSYRARFEKEIDIGRMVAQSAASQWAVPIVDEGEFEGKPFFVMPYMPHNLRALLDEPVRLEALLATSPWSIEQSTDVWIRILRQLAEAIDALHRAGFVHGDLKPSNILLDETGRLRIIDFGAAHLSQLDYRSMQRHSISRDIQEPAIAGTLVYMAPEQFEGARPSKATDLYALGTIAWEMMYGQLPYPLLAHDTQHTYARRKESGQPSTPYRSGVPSSVRQVLLRALRADPRYRFPSAQAFIEELERAWDNPDTYQLKDPPPVLSYLAIGYACLAATAYLVIQRLWLLLGQ